MNASDTPNNDLSNGVMRSNDRALHYVANITSGSFGVARCLLNVADTVNNFCFKCFTSVKDKSEYLTVTAVDRASTVLASQVETFGRLAGNHQSAERYVSSINSFSDTITRTVSTLASTAHSASSTGHMIASYGIDASQQAVNICDRTLSTCCQTASMNVVTTPLRPMASALYNLSKTLGIKHTPMQLKRAASVYSSLQEYAMTPYPRSLGTSYVNIDANKKLFTSLQRGLLQCLAPYPLTALHYFGVLPKTAVTRDAATLAMLCVIEDDIFCASWDSSVVKPAYLAFMDHEHKNIVVVVRGSTQLSDIITDAYFIVDAEGNGHHGMHDSAINVDLILRDKIISKCNEYPTYKVVVQGHSLGGGVATLLGIRWMAIEAIAGIAPDFERLSVYSFASPCVSTVDKSSLYRQNITSVFYSKDMIARFSLGSVNRVLKIFAHLLRSTSKQNEDNAFPPMPDDVPSTSNIDKAQIPYLTELADHLTLKNLSTLIEQRRTLASDSNRETVVSLDLLLRNCYQALMLNIGDARYDAQCLFPVGRVMVLMPIDDVIEGHINSPDVITNWPRSTEQNDDVIEESNAVTTKCNVSLPGTNGTTTVATTSDIRRQTCCLSPLNTTDFDSSTYEVLMNNDRRNSMSSINENDAAQNDKISEWCRIFDNENFFSDETREDGSSNRLEGTSIWKGVLIGLSSDSVIDVCSSIILSTKSLRAHSVRHLCAALGILY